MLLRALSSSVLVLTIGCATQRGPGTESIAADVVLTNDVSGALDWTLGDWEGVRIDAADRSEAPMEMTVRAILGGAAQTREMRIVTGSGFYRGFQVQVRHADTGRWTRQYVNDVRRTFAKLESVDATGNVWRSTTPGRSRESRIVCERLEDDGWRRTMSISDDGVEWRPLWIDELWPVGRSGT